MENEIIIGRNSVLEALNSGRPINKILVQSANKKGSIRKIIGLAKSEKIVIQEVSKEKLDSLAKENNHQGVIAYVAAYRYSSLDEILDSARKKEEDPFIVIVEDLKDPHNLGAIIRTANAAGAHGIIIPKRRSVGLTATVGNVSAGAIEYTPVARVTNLVRTIDRLKEEGLWISCADMDGEPMYEVDLKGPVALVIGGEGEGVSRLVKENCDFIVSMPMKGQINSLNASVAAALLMYEVVRQREY